MDKYLKKLDKHELRDLYKKMVLIRNFEEAASEMYLRGKISEFTHLYIGEEAVAVGVISSLFDKDYIVSSYREHGHAIAKGASVKSVMAELFGKATGLCKGFGGSMHLFDQDLRFMGGYAIVGAGMPIATGLALSIKYKDEDTICACFFGDGAINEGAFHESLNLAKLWNLPVLFICENNLYGMGTEVERASSITDIYKRAEAYNIPSECVNGMDIMEVKNAVDNASRKIRRGAGPYFIEAKTYRFKAHSMADPDRYRTIQEAEIWKERCPIENLAKELIDEGIFTPDELKEVKEETKNEIKEAIDYAEESPNPGLEMLYEFVYAE